MIELKNVSKSFYTKNQEIKAVDSLSLKIEKKDIFGIIGYSGAGKSTLIRCLNLLEEYDSGEILVENEELKSLSKSALLKKREKIGMIFQHFHLLQSQNVYHNIANVLKHTKGFPKNKIKERVLEVLKLVDLEDKIYAYPSQLSGGQKQRVAIARALSRDCKILLCDEATSALDPNTTKSILQLLKKINETLGVTIVLITHQMEVVKAICNKVAVMENGKLIESGEVLEVFSNPITSTTKQFVEENRSEVIKLLKEKHKELYRISFIGNIVDEPILSKIQKKYDIYVNILVGNIEVLGDKKIGNVIVEVIGNDKDKAISALLEKGLKVEQL